MCGQRHPARAGGVRGGAPATARLRRPLTEGRELTGLHVVVDGSGLARLWAGVGTYTAEILRALAAERPDNRFTVFTQAEPGIEQPAIAFRRPPSIQLIGRHLLWPAW